MPTYKAPVDDALFLLNDVFHIDRYGNLPGFSDASPDVVEAVLREAAKSNADTLAEAMRTLKEDPSIGDIVSVCGSG